MKKSFLTQQTKYIFLLMLWQCNIHAATPSQDLSLITQSADAFVSQETKSLDADVDYSITPLDSRLILAACEGELISFLPPGSRLDGKTTIGVKCNSKAQYWTVYVSADIRIYKNVVTTTHPLERGHTISESDLSMTRMETTRLRASYYTEPSQIIGKITTRRLATDAPVPSSAITLPDLIKRGQQVAIIASNKNIAIQMFGKALASGKAGDIIKVKNTNSDRVVEGKIVEAGVIEVNF